MVLTTLLTVVAVRAAAQNVSEPVTLPPVRVSAPARLPDAPLPLDHVPATVQIISGDRARESGAVTLQDALTPLPGVTTADEQGSSAQRDLSLRGFSATPVTGVPQGISVFVDGVRVNEPTAEEVNFDLISLEDVERIEVIRGPTALFGRNTLGGAVNLLTRRGGEATELEAALQAGSFGRRQYRLRLSGPASPFDYYVAGSLLQEDGWRDASAARLGKLFAKLGLRAGDTDLTLSFQRAENRIEQPGSLPLSELRRDRQANFSAGDVFKPRANLVTLTARQLLGERTGLTLNAFARALDAEQFNTNLLGPNTRSFAHTLSAGGAVQVDHDTRALGHADRLSAGLEYAHHDSDVDVFDEAGGGARTLDSRVRDDQHAWALYAQNTLDVARDTLAAGDRLVLTTAARWDWLRHGIGDAGPVGLRPRVDTTSTFSRVNPRVGLNYNLTPAVGVYFVYAQGFRAPAFLELTCASPAAVCPGLQAGLAPDPPLKAVTADHYEVGGRLAPWTWLALEAAAFRTDVHDDIFSVSPTGTTGVFFQNVGGTRRQGVELAAEATLDRRWRLRLGYAYTEATFRDDVQLATPRTTPGCVAPPCLEGVRAGDELPLVPRHRVNAAIEHHLTSWLALWVSGAWVGAQRLRGDEENVERTLTPYVTLAAGARARRGGLSAFLTVSNPLNDDHETFGTFARNPRAPGAPVEPFLTPAPPVRVDVGVAWQF
ncbi:MAG TPA: TonB-dependent receptor [Methylomirabilota bacterium]|nr:TonB-dependent receptor [Methylomirabilota bacterium]